MAPRPTARQTARSEEERRWAVEGKFQLRKPYSHSWRFERVFVRTQLPSELAAQPSAAEPLCQNPLRRSSAALTAALSLPPLQNFKLQNLLEMLIALFSASLSIACVSSVTFTDIERQRYGHMISKAPAQSENFMYK